VKVKTFHSYGAVLTGLCAGESEDFQQLKGVLGSCTGSCAGESGKYQQLRGVFHGPLAGESGNHVRFIHVSKS
jgi:hypothetical protein